MKTNNLKLKIKNKRLNLKKKTKKSELNNIS